MKTTKCKKGTLVKKVVLVKWNDISKSTNSELDERASIDSFLGVMETTGVIWKESDDCILLAQEFWNFNGKLSVRDWVVIPKSVIIDIMIMGEME